MFRTEKTLRKEITNGREIFDIQIQFKQTNMEFYMKDC